MNEFEFTKDNQSNPPLSKGGEEVKAGKVPYLMTALVNKHPASPLFKARIRRLAGLKGRDPGISQCGPCKKFVLYDQDRNGNAWIDGKHLDAFVKTLREALPDVYKKSLWFPVVSHGYCNPCAEDAYKEIK